MQDQVWFFVVFIVYTQDFMLRITEDWKLENDLVIMFIDSNKALNCIGHPHCKKCGIIFDTAVSANHTFIRVISTPTVPYSTPLVWYAHFIFYSAL